MREATPLVDRLWAHEVAVEPLTTPEQRAGFRARMAELAKTIGDPVVRSEYQAEFRRRYDEQFGQTRRPFERGRSFEPRQPFVPRRPGQKWTPPPLPVTDDAKAFRAAGIDRVLAKAVLAGLIRHPAEIARHMEVLGSLRMADGALGRLFEAVVDVALEDRELDSARLVTILRNSGFEAVARDLLRADTMPYSFTQPTGDASRAREDLDEAIAILVTQPEVDAALADATSAMQARFTDEAFQRQVALVKEKQALELRLANLVQSNEDARAFDSEDD